MKKYKVYLSAIKCNRFYSNFMRACDLGIDDIGVRVEISFTIEQEPTKEVIDKIIFAHEQAKYNKDLEEYFVNVKLNRIEVILDEDKGKAKSSSNG